MNLIGPRMRSGRAALLVKKSLSGHVSPVVEPPRVKTPYWLLWLTGIVAVVLCIIAFLLWGFNGTGTLFDMIVALCS
jgi:hypothetical protein